MLRQGLSRKDPRRSAFPVPKHAWTTWSYDSKYAWHRRGMLWRTYFWMAWRGLVGLGLVVKRARVGEVLGSSSLRGWLANGWNLLVSQVNIPNSCQLLLGCQARSNSGHLCFPHPRCGLSPAIALNSLPGALTNLGNNLPGANMMNPGSSGGGSSQNGAGLGDPWKSWQ